MKRGRAALGETDAVAGASYRPWGESAFCLRLRFRGVRLDIGPEDGVDPGLVAGALPLKPFHNVFVQPQGEMGFGGRHHDLRLLPELGVCGRDVRVVNLAVRHLLQLRPGRAAPLWRGLDSFGAHVRFLS